MKTGWSCFGGTDSTNDQCGEICGDGLLVGDEDCDDMTDDQIGCEFGCIGSAQDFEC